MRFVHIHLFSYYTGSYIPSEEIREWLGCHIPEIVQRVACAAGVRTCPYLYRNRPVVWMYVHTSQNMDKEFPESMEIATWTNESSLAAKLVVECWRSYPGMPNFRYFPLFLAWSVLRRSVSRFPFSPFSPISSFSFWTFCLFLCSFSVRRHAHVDFQLFSQKSIGIPGYHSLTFAYFKPFLGLKYRANPDWSKKMLTQFAPQTRLSCFWRVVASARRRETFVRDGYLRFCVPAVEGESPS